MSLIVARRMLLVVLPGLLAGRAGRLAGQGGEAVSAAVAKFVRSQRLPKPQTPRLLLAVRDERVEIFSVSYGEPQDCMVGCFYSWLSGLRFAGKIGWMDCDRSDHSRFDHPITCFDVDSTDRYLFTADLLARLDHLEEPGSYWLAHSAFRPMLVRDPDTPVAVLERFAREIYTVAPDQFMERLLFENRRVQRSAAILTLLASPPDSLARFYGGARAQAAQLLCDELGDSLARDTTTPASTLQLIAEMLHRPYLRQALVRLLLANPRARHDLAILTHLATVGVLEDRYEYLRAQARPLLLAELDGPGREDLAAILAPRSYAIITGTLDRLVFDREVQRNRKAMTVIANLPGSWFTYEAYKKLYELGWRRQ